MENDQHHYELRSGSRSRSQTPLVQNRALMTEADSVDHHYDLRTHSRERSHTPGDIGSNRRSGTRSLPGNLGKTTEQSMETITENKEEFDRGTLNENENRVSESSSSVSVKKVERRSERQKAKRQIYANGQSGSKDDSTGQKIKEKRKSVSPRRILTSDYSSEEGDREDTPNKPTSAHEIYKRAGDWWNVFPKTDYTYSEKSECRYEIAPGVLAMPNMSRRSIHANGSSTTDGILSLSKENRSQSTFDTFESGLGDTLEVEKSKGSSAQSPTSMDQSCNVLSKLRPWSYETGSKILYNKTHVERYRSHQEIYTVPDGSTENLHARSSLKRIYSQKYDVTSDSVDSDVELDDSVFASTSNVNRKFKITQWLTSFVGFVTLWFTKVLEFLRLKTVRNREYRSSYEYRRYKEPKWYGAWRYVDHSLQYIYLLMLRIFMLDSLLLSRASSVTKPRQKKGRKLFWIAVVPLLLLAGIYVVQKQSFARLDSLRDIPYGVTEMTYHIFNDITNLTSFEYDLLVKYITNIKNSSLHFLPSVNVSLPEIPNIGWNLTW